MQTSPKVHLLIIIVFSTITNILIQKAYTTSSPSSNCDGNVILSFPTFNASSCKPGGDLLCMGAIYPGEGFLNLTKAASNNLSSLDYMRFARVLYNKPVQVWPASFCTSFSFRIYSKLNQLKYSGDGMTFVMAQDNKSPPNISVGSYLGLQDQLQGKSDFKQLAVEFDTFKNEWDPDDNHIAIDTYSAMHSLVAKSSPIDLKSGNQIKVQIEYNGHTKNLQIYMGYEGKPLTSFLNYSIKVSKIIPKNVYIGFTAATGLLTETHQLHDWVFTSTILSDNTLKDNKKLCIIILSIVIPILVLLAVIAIPVIRRRMIRKMQRIRRMEELERQYAAAAAAAPRKFTYKQLAKATKNFSKDNLLGTGGFGSVYKGVIKNSVQTIAVKKISSTSQQGEREYIAEICTIGHLRHRNILQLQGWSHENDSLLLVYDFMANKSLNEFLSGRKFLDWKTREKVITGLASALLYLHEECGDPVVHRDVKPSNVMLDAEFNPRLGDFGLARLLKNTTGVTTMVAGTLGYMAPEVSYTGKATTESDVYSFGVVALEVVCGKRFSTLLGESCLVDYAWDMYAKGTLVECVDPKLGEDFFKDKAERILSLALACLHLESNLRPKMRKVVMVLLNSNEPLMKLPSTRPKGVYVSLSGFSNPPSTSNNSKPSTPLFSWPDYPSSSTNTSFQNESLAR
ncbi:L-type lectin-domain containing receptor kinase IX.1-like [Chenopodium quinoa]|uniref:L-type lectin-domain containing receptor kinase IX.1-like n=1 Tax=Chenopodium quinoa TaxID=63459 RepID=UPI000B7994FA|nr:L-type lectin-domain containing receptor kinase IX.1-like [Chenopodium quinoa]